VSTHRFTIDTQLDAVAGLSAQVSAACSALGLNQEAIWDLELAIAEAASNVISHGYGDRAGGSLAVEVHPDGVGVRVDVLDRGTPIPQGMLEKAGLGDPPSDITDLADSGRGLALIKASVDGWSYETSPSGNRLSLVKHRAA